MVVEVAAQVVSQNMKSNRQIQYHHLSHCTTRRTNLILLQNSGNFNKNENYIEDKANSESRQVIIFDAMTIVNKIDVKAESIENCDECVSKFCEIINFEGRGFDGVRIIFDR